MERILIDDYHIEITSTKKLSADEVYELNKVMYSCKSDLIDLIKGNMRKSTADKLRFNITQ